MKRAALLTAEIFAGFLIFMLPVKFGTIAGLPQTSMVYWQDWFALILLPLPLAYFPLFAGVFLLFVLLAVPRSETCGKPLKIYGLLWGLLSLSACLGALGNPVPDGNLYHLPYLFSLGAFMTGFALLLNADSSFAKKVLVFFTAGFLFTLYSGLEQYFSGFESTLQELEKSGLAKYENEAAIARLREGRVTGPFTACNAFAGYLTLGIFPAAAVLWRLGKKVNPPRVSQILFTVPVVLAALFLLVKTGSRGALISLAAGAVLTLFVMNTGKKWKWILGGVLVPAGVFGFTGMILLGRGAKSLLFRLDYWQAAFRIMLKNPLTGAGWGSFQRNFMLWKMIEDAEAPASPHHFPLSVGAQSGVLGFVIACAILIFPLWAAGKKLRKTAFADLSGGQSLFAAALYAGVAAWSFHSLQDVLFETPGAILPAAAAAACLLVLTMDENEFRKPRFSGLFVRAVLLIFAGITLYGGVRLFRFDFALSALTDASDPKMAKYLQIPPERAGELYQVCRKLNPASPYPASRLAAWNFVRGNTAAGVRLLEENLKLDPDNAGMNYRMYKIYREMPGMEQRAEEYRKRAMELAPMNPKFREGE